MDRVIDDLKKKIKELEERNKDLSSLNIRYQKEVLTKYDDIIGTLN